MSVELHPPKSKVLRIIWSSTSSLKVYIWFSTMGCHICSLPNLTELWALWNFPSMAHFKHLSCTWGLQHGKADLSEPSHNMKGPWRIYKHLIRSHRTRAVSTTIVNVEWRSANTQSETPTQILKSTRGSFVFVMINDFLIQYFCLNVFQYKYWNIIKAYSHQGW